MPNFWPALSESFKDFLHFENMTKTSYYSIGFGLFRKLTYVFSKTWFETKSLRALQWVKSVRIWSFSGLYSVGIRENTDQEISE